MVAALVRLSGRGTRTPEAALHRRLPRPGRHSRSPSCSSSAPRPTTWSVFFHHTIGLPVRPLRPVLDLGLAPVPRPGTTRSRLAAARPAGGARRGRARACSLAAPPHASAPRGVHRRAARWVRGDPDLLVVLVPDLVLPVRRLRGGCAQAEDRGPGGRRGPRRSARRSTRRRGARRWRTRGPGGHPGSSTSAAQCSLSIVFIGSWALLTHGPYANPRIIDTPLYQAIRRRDPHPGSSRTATSRSSIRRARSSRSSLATLGSDYRSTFGWLMAGCGLLCLLVRGARASAGPRLGLPGGRAAAARLDRADALRLLAGSARGRRARGFPAGPAQARMGGARGCLRRQAVPCGPRSARGGLDAAPPGAEGARARARDVRSWSCSRSSCRSSPSHRGGCGTA